MSVDRFQRATEEVARKHRTTSSTTGWSCSCGKSNTWDEAPPSRGEAAANRHKASEYRKALAAPEPDKAGT